jgi:hypothetical protein
MLLFLVIEKGCGGGGFPFFFVIYDRVCSALITYPSCSDIGPSQSRHSAHQKRKNNVFNKNYAKIKHGNR